MQKNEKLKYYKISKGNHYVKNLYSKSEYRDSKFILQPNNIKISFNLSTSLNYFNKF